MLDLRIGERPSWRNAVPFEEASPAAGRGRMLRDEHGMPSHGRRFYQIAPEVGSRPRRGAGGSGVSPSPVPHDRDAERNLAEDFAEGSGNGTGERVVDEPEEADGDE